MGVRRRGAPCVCGCPVVTGVPHGGSPARPLAPPPVIRPGQGGSGAAVPTLAPGRERSLPAVLPPVREGRGGAGASTETNNSHVGIRSPSEGMNGRKRRGSHLHLQNLVGASLRVPVCDFRFTLPALGPGRL